MKESSFRQRVMREIRLHDPEANFTGHSIESVHSRGFPDMFYINPKGTVLLVEFKRADARESALQERFRQACRVLNGSLHILARVYSVPKSPPEIKVSITGQTFTFWSGEWEHVFKRRLSFDEFIQFLLNVRP
jgi:hypothetical protein